VPAVTPPELGLRLLSRPRRSRGAAAALGRAARAREDQLAVPGHRVLPEGRALVGKAAMDFVVEPAALSGGAVAVPGDKSISHRALMLAALAQGTSRIRGFLAGEDCLATLAALAAMGVKI